MTKLDKIRQNLTIFYKIRQNITNTKYAEEICSYFMKFARTDTQVRPNTNLTALTKLTKLSQNRSKISKIVVE